MNKNNIDPSKLDILVIDCGEFKGDPVPCTSHQLLQLYKGAKYVRVGEHEFPKDQELRHDGYIITGSSTLIRNTDPTLDHWYRQTEKLIKSLDVYLTPPVLGIDTGFLLLADALGGGLVIPESGKVISALDYKDPKANKFVVPQSERIIQCYEVSMFKCGVHYGLIWQIELFTLTAEEKANTVKWNGLISFYNSLVYKSILQGFAKKVDERHRKRLAENN